MIIRPAPRFPQNYPINNSRPRNAGEFTADGALLPAAIALADATRPVQPAIGHNPLRAATRFASPARRPWPEASNRGPSA